MNSILLGFVYLGVVLVIFWSIAAERVSGYMNWGPFAPRAVPPASLPRRPTTSQVEQKLPRP
jgi:hypothetical protein